MNPSLEKSLVLSVMLAATALASTPISRFRKIPCFASTG